MEPRVYQNRTVEQTLEAFAAGFHRTVVTLPTGGGKSLIMQILARLRLAERRPVALFTHRTLLTDQVSDSLMDENIYHGVRAAGYADERDHPFQVCSIHTERSRVLKRKREVLHACIPGGLAMFDEGHLYNNPTGQEVIRQYQEAGADVALFTASPADMAAIADHLIIGATNSELREAGVLVPARHIRVCEPDMRRFRALQAKLERGMQPSEKEAAAAMPPPVICGHVLNDFEKHNPEIKRTIGFAPSVAGSLYFAEEFFKRGHKTAHIDSKNIWWNGNLYRSDPKVREELIGTKEKPGAFRLGDVRVLWNRFVLREAVDVPEVEHIIFATALGFIAFLQGGGRGLRACPWIGKTHCTYQDHAGLYYRYGSLNEDIVWRLDDTAARIVGVRLDRIRQRKQKEPFGCPQCGRVWVAARFCNRDLGGCGFEFKSVPRSRPVIAADGRLETVSGDLIKPRRIARRPDSLTKWQDLIIYRAHSPKWNPTFNQAEAVFAKENKWFYPDRSWPLMPLNDLDFYLPVARVPAERLRGDPALLDRLKRQREKVEAKRQSAAQSEPAEVEAELFV